MPPSPGSGPPRRKRFGQHFLHDPAVLERTLEALAPQAGDHLVEIGPGRGALTRQLIARSRHHAGCHRDRPRPGAAARAAVQRLPALPAARRRTCWSSTSTPSRSARGGKLRVIGNLPYNISTPLLFHLLGQASAVTDLHVMLQREVVERMAAAPGSKDYGRLTIMLAPYVRGGIPVRCRAGGLPAPAAGLVGGGAPHGARAAAVRCQPALRRAGRGGLHAAPQDAAQRAERVPQPRADQRLRHRSGRAAGNARHHWPSTPSPRPSTARARNASLPSTACNVGDLAMAYRHILLVVDLTEDSLAISRRAHELATALGAQLHLLHVVEFVSVDPLGETLMPVVEMESELLEQAQRRLAALAAQLGAAGERLPGRERQRQGGDRARGARAAHRPDRARQPRAPWTVDPGEPDGRHGAACRPVRRAGDARRPCLRRALR